MIGAPYSNDTTSRAAAAALAPEHRLTQRALVLHHFENRNSSTHPVGFTDDELRQLTGLEYQSLNPRRWQLAKDGKLRDSGVRRATRNGLSAIVWELVLGDAGA